jgi:hypothetical protein
MRWAVTTSALVIAAATTFALPPGTPVGSPFMPGQGPGRVHSYRDISVPIAQVTTLGNVSIRGGIVDVVQLKKLENGSLTTETIVSGARTVGIAPDHKSILLRLPDIEASRLHSSLSSGNIILTPHR